MIYTPWLTAEPSGKFAATFCQTTSTCGRFRPVPSGLLYQYKVENHNKGRGIVAVVVGIFVQIPVTFFGLHAQVGNQGGECLGQTPAYGGLYLSHYILLSRPESGFSANFPTPAPPLPPTTPTPPTVFCYP